MIDSPSVYIRLKENVTVGGGFFTGRYTSLDDKAEPGSRFDPEKLQGKASKCFVIVLFVADAWYMDLGLPQQVSIYLIQVLYQ